MVDLKLVEYIKQQLANGYDTVAIRSFLISKGYQQQQVDEAINYTYSKPKTPKTNPLTDYANKWLAQGYSPESVRNSLLQQGYPQQQVDEAISSIQSEKKPISLKTPLIILTIILFIGVAAATGYYFLSIEDKTEVTDYRISISEASIMPGDTLYFTNNFIGNWDKRKEEVVIDYQITNKDTGQEISSWQEKFSKDETLTKSMQFLTPTDTYPGSYRLNVEISYKDFTKTTYANFKIYVETVEETCYDNIKNQNEVGVDCGGTCSPCVVEETCYDRIKNQDETSTDCGGVCGPCEIETTTKTTEPEPDQEFTDYQETRDNDYQNIDLAKATAHTDSFKAASYCEEVAMTENRDKCYNEIAKISVESRYCANIAVDNTRDSCYIHFAFNHDQYDTCDYLVNQFVKQSCDQLAKINELQIS